MADQEITKALLKKQLIVVEEEQEEKFKHEESTKFSLSELATWGEFWGFLGVTTEEIPQHILLLILASVTGLGLLLFQLFLFPVAERILGAIMIARIEAVLSIILLSSYPYIAKLSGFWLSVTLDCASVLNECVIRLFLLQNRAVSQDQRGDANGISLSAMSLSKAIGPAAGASLFSWAQRHQDAHILPGNQMVFFILNVVEFIGLLMTLKPFLTLPEENVSNEISKTSNESR